LKDRDLLNQLIGRTVSVAIEKGIIKSKSIIVDAAHTGSRRNPCSRVEILRFRSGLLRKTLYDVDGSVREGLPLKNEDNSPEHELNYPKALLEAVSDNQAPVSVPEVMERLNMLGETLPDIEDHNVTSTEEDVRVGHKSEESSFFGYRTHIAMGDERIITAARVTSREKGDVPRLPELVEQSRNNVMEVETVTGDAAYPGKENIRPAQDEQGGFEPVAKLNPAVSRRFRREDQNFEFNKDAGMFVCLAFTITPASPGNRKNGRVRSWTDFTMPALTVIAATRIRVKLRHGMSSAPWPLI
jgi:hypothetical protein